MSSGRPHSPPKAYVSWSSGKDSAFALHEARRLELAQIVGVFSTVNEVYDRVAMHGVRRALLERQVEALGLPAVQVPIPSPCSNDVYEHRMARLCEQLLACGIRHIVFGDLFLEDIRAYRMEKLSALGIEPIFPLWKRDTAALALQMIESGLCARIVCLDPRRLDRRFAGRRFDAELLHDLPGGVDPCGENGEFHTAVTGGPMLAYDIAVRTGETVERDGFVFTDLIPE